MLDFSTASAGLRFFTSLFTFTQLFWNLVVLKELHGQLDHGCWNIKDTGNTMHRHFWSKSMWTLFEEVRCIKFNLGFYVFQFEGQNPTHHLKQVWLNTKYINSTKSYFMESESKREEWPCQCLRERRPWASTWYWYIKTLKNTTYALPRNHFLHLLYPECRVWNGSGWVREKDVYTQIDPYNRKRASPKWANTF